MIEEAHQLWPAAHPDLPVGERLSLVGGDFFQAVPQADVYFLKHVSRRWLGGYLVGGWWRLEGADAWGRAARGDEHSPAAWPEWGNSQLLLRNLTLCCASLEMARLQILHDWNDEDSVKVCQTAAGSAVPAMQLHLVAQGWHARAVCRPLHEPPCCCLTRAPACLPARPPADQILKTVRTAAAPESRVLLCEVRWPAQNAGRRSACEGVTHTWAAFGISMQKALAGRQSNIPGLPSPPLPPRWCCPRGGPTAWRRCTSTSRSCPPPAHTTAAANCRRLADRMRHLIPLPFVQMMVMCGSKERSAGDWQQLLEAGGWVLDRIVPLGLPTGHGIVVGRPA